MTLEKYIEVVESHRATEQQLLKKLLKEPKPKKAKKTSVQVSVIDKRNKTLANKLKKAS